MKTPGVRALASLVLAFFIVTTAGCQSPDLKAHEESSRRIYYAVEINGVLCGYAVMDTSRLVIDGGERMVLEEEVFVMVSALGSEFNTEIQLTYHLDPGTGKFTYHDSKLRQGQVDMDSKIRIEGDSARMTSSLDEKTIVTPLSEDVVLENTLFFPHLVEDFVVRGAREKVYRVYEVREAEIQKTTYTRVGTETLELVGKRYEAIILDELNHANGLKLKWWIDTQTGEVLKADLPTGRQIYRADHTVRKQIAVATLDDNIYVRTNEAIADIKSISYMKVRATVEPIGLWVTEESLNVPGQRFTGTVKENVIEGVFEIDHPRYDGLEAPPFPPDFSSDESLREYLEASEFIEADDPVLVAKAREITEGSKDSWEAARRLSRWVSKEIGYAIPGGMTARKTYDMREGECGAHSLLLSGFCRGVGIPARVVWGAMYTPNRGGAFAQHGWNELYMGKAGWIPVDATASEIDYVDCGHIRLGELQSPSTAFNGKEMEILDYRAGSLSMGDQEEGVPAKYEPYVGNYDFPGEKPMSVLVQGGKLAVDIPGKMVLAFDDPNERGEWCCALSDKLYCCFGRDNAGAVEYLELHELITLPRSGESDEKAEDVPERFKPYLGKYRLSMLNAEFTVGYMGKSLAVYDPLEKRNVGLRLPDKDGKWMDEFNKNTIFFDIDGDGTVTAMNIDSKNIFNKQD
jgi:transglutaminase-like putative cysteine protease